MQLRRRDLMVGAGASAAGGIVGLGLGRYALRKFPSGANPSYSQCGEDVISAMIFDFVGIKSPTYLDIGAWMPIARNNTYLFYTRGGRGVLVEPNVALIPELRAKRARDTVLNAGVGITADKAADFYCLSNSQWNSFDKEEVDRRLAEAKGSLKLEKVVKMPLVPINDIMRDHFQGQAPDFVSIDVEGLDLDILKTVDFERYRPKIFCVETVIAMEYSMDPEITDFLAGKGYEARATTFPNTIYVDREAIPKKA
jgi:FkbM family methyltransferase